MSFYDVGELTTIVDRNARLLDLGITANGALEIARRSRGTPRVAGRLLRRVRDFAAVDGHKVVDEKVADAALSRLDVDLLGLDALDRRFLGCIAKNYAGGPVGIETLAAALSEERDTLEEVIEPYLIRQGLLMRTSRGRVLAEGAYRHLGLAPPTNIRQLELLASVEPTPDQRGDLSDG
jgi:Holliday junction DNA helicase RuvB